MLMSNIITVLPEQEQVIEDDPNNPEHNPEESKSKEWIAAPIVVCLIIIGLIIYLICDFKNKLFIFKNKEESIPPVENQKNIEYAEKIEVTNSINTPKINRKRSIKNSKFASLAMKTSN